MTDIFIHATGNHQVTCIPNAFIDNYMQEANGEFVKIYLYLVRSLAAPGAHFSVASMADRLHYTEGDILRGLTYWEKEGLLRLEFDATKNLIGLCLLDPWNHPQTPPVKSQPTPTPAPTIEASSQPVAATTKKEASYTPEELSSFKHQEGIQELLMVTETYIGHTLSMTDLNTILFWFDVLSFSPELIEFLVEYCVEKGHGSIHYMNKVALDWKDKGIETVEQAKQTANIHSQSSYVVMKAFGISGRNLVSSEIAYIEKWTNLYAFSLDIISEACNRTIANTGKASFKYADTILTKWHQDGILHLEDIERLDKSHSEKATKAAPRVAKNNRFHNFDQRKHDDDFYEALEQKLLQK